MTQRTDAGSTFSSYAQPAPTRSEDRGYRNKYQLVDRLAAAIAGVAALGVAFFPTRAPDGFTAATWWTETTGVLHYVSAVVLFAMFAVFSLWLFRLTGNGAPPSADKRNRNRVYLVCGIAIVASIAWAGVAGMNKQSILVPESIALVAFAVSWLVKGRVDKSIVDTARSIGSKVKGKT